MATAFATILPPSTLAPSTTVPQPTSTNVPVPAEVHETTPVTIPPAVLPSVPPSVPTTRPPEPTPAPPPTTVLAEVDLDEPSFDIGTSVELDLDLARFPVDDAGLGGGLPVPDAGQQGPDEGSVGEDDAPGSGWAAVDRYIESTLIRPGNTAVSYAVSIDGDVVHAAAFGVRDPARGDPAGPDDRFRVASISKPITAIVALSLVEDGMVSLDEPVGRRIADHVGLESISSGAERLTLRALLTHRTGYGKFQSTFFGNGALDCADAARRGLSGGGGGGGGYLYSNMNYCLAGMLIEALTGESYEQAVYTHLLTPLGISGMRLPPTVDPGPGEIQHRTTPGRNYMETLGGAGSWIATPADLVTIIDALDLSTSGYKPLNQETVFQMVIPAGGAYGQQGYGLGVISYGGGRFGHTGTIEATHAMLLNRGDGVTWAITVAGDIPTESTDLERIMDRAFAEGGFVDG